MVQGKGAVLRASLHENVTPEYVQKVWHKVNDMSNSVLCENNHQFMGNLLKMLEDLKDTSKSNGEAGKEYTNKFDYGSKDLILYALGSKEHKKKLKYYMS